MRTAKVVVLPYDEGWKIAFQEIKHELEQAVAELIIGIEHIGSTAVEGMSAKPCIDMDLVIRDHAAFDEVAARLAAIGYVHEGDLGIPDREAFAYSNKPHLYKHHLYVCPQHSAELHLLLRFLCKQNQIVKVISIFKLSVNYTCSRTLSAVMRRGFFHVRC